MKTVGFSAVLCMALGASAMAQDTAAAPPNASLKGTQSFPPATTLINDAVKRAKAEHKPVFVYLGNTVRCHACTLLDKFLESSEVSPIMAAHYVLVPLTAMGEVGNDLTLPDNPGADSILQAMHAVSVPVFFILDEQGKQIASSLVMPPNGGNMGYPGTPEEVKMFGELLQKTAPRMSDADRAKVIGYLTDVGTAILSHAH